MSKFPLKILSALITKIETEGNVGIGIWLLFEETQNVGEICVKGTEINNYRTCGQEGSKIGFNYLHIPHLILLHLHVLLRLNTTKPFIQNRKVIINSTSYNFECCLKYSNIKDKLFGWKYNNTNNRLLFIIFNLLNDNETIQYWWHNSMLY